MIYKRHPIESIEGIGKVWGSRLRDAGIVATEDLLDLSETRQSRIMNNIAQFPMANYRKFVAAAEFLLLDGLTGQHAEGVIRAGRLSLLELSAPDPSTLVKEVEKARKEGIIPEAIDLKTANRWQKQAIKISLMGSIMGAIANEGEPIEGAIIYCAMQEAVTDKYGKFYLPMVPFGKSEVVINAPGYKRSRIIVDIRPDKRKTRLALMLQRGNDVVVESSEKDKPILKILAEDRLVFIDQDIMQIADGTPLVFQHFKKNGAVVLNAVYRHRKGNEIQVFRIVAPKGSLEMNAHPGNIYYWKKGQFIRSNKTLSELRADAVKNPGRYKQKVRVRKIAQHFQ